MCLMTPLHHHLRPYAPCLCIPSHPHRHSHPTLIPLIQYIPLSPYPTRFLPSHTHTQTKGFFFSSLINFFFFALTQFPSPTQQRHNSPPSTHQVPTYSTISPSVPCRRHVSPPTILYCTVVYCIYVLTHTREPPRTNYYYTYTHGRAGKVRSITGLGYCTRAAPSHLNPFPSLSRRRRYSSIVRTVQHHPANSEQFIQGSPNSRCCVASHRLHPTHTAVQSSPVQPNNPPTLPP